MISGHVAQLNSASDYGSEGSRFESWRGHLSMKSSPEKAGFFFSNEAQACLQAEVSKEKVASQGLGAFHVDYGAARKTERSEGNPAAVQGLHFQAGVGRKTARSGVILRRQVE